MIRFWIELSDPKLGRPSFVGVTAWSLDDALGIIATRYYAGGRPVPPRRVVENIDVSTLPTWVRQSMAPPNWRGVWYPVSGIQPE